MITPTPGAVPRAAPTDPVRPRRHAPIRSKELTMLTFKEALCLLAIVVAYGITCTSDRFPTNEFLDLSKAVARLSQRLGHGLFLG